MDQRIHAASENEMRAVLLTLCEDEGTRKRIMEQLRAIEHMKKLHEKLQGGDAKKRKRRSYDSQGDPDHTLHVNNFFASDAETD